MKKLFAIIPVLWCVSTAWGGNPVPGNAERGARVFQSKGCASCHPLAGKGGRNAPDLAKRPEGRFTPALLASALWNHGPRMWDTMKANGQDVPRLTAQEAADLFAYLYSYRYFEEQGDRARGRRVFESKGCAGCHGSNGQAAPVSDWGTIHDPIELARSMWNHSSGMSKAVRTRNSEWPALTGQDLADIVAYVRAEPGAPKGATRLAVASPATGEELFREKGCEKCHAGPRSLAGKAGSRTMTDLAAAMWNHVPQMGPQARDLRPEEMTRLVGYLWSIQYFDEAGDPAAGLKAAVSGGCVSCHGQLPAAGAPRFTAMAGKLNAISWMASVWNHGEEMRRAIRLNGKGWPELDRPTVNNLLTYINSLR